MIRSNPLVALAGLLSTRSRRRGSSLARRGERGAVTLLVAIFLGGGVLMGMGALVVDVGQIYAEREELQSSADAAAMALAKGCVADPHSCGNQSAKAATYANSNASDGASTVTVICGTGTGLSACPAQVGGVSSCVGSTPSSPYVEVRTATALPDGSGLLPPTFAQAIAGNSSYTGKQVHACARAAWGAPQSATAAAVTIATCEWNQLTANGNNLAPPPPEIPNKSAEGIIRLHDSKNAGTCPAGPSGWDAPGGFGWLDEPAGPCSALVTAGGTFGGDPGVSTSADCQTVLSQARSNKTTLMMPIYDGIKGTGSGTTYHLDGFSAFVVTGYYLSSFSASSWLSGKNLCNGSERCLYGYFTTALIPTSGTLAPGGTDYGTSIITMVG
jgi:Flp pilus assembly protein TadG